MTLHVPQGANQAFGSAVGQGKLPEDWSGVELEWLTPSEHSRRAGDYLLAPFADHNANGVSQ